LGIPENQIHVQFRIVIGMEYLCKNSKKEKLTSFMLSDLAMQVRGPSKDEVVHYSGVKSVWINKELGVFSVTVTTMEGNQYVISNRFVHDDGRVENKSNAYALFVRVLHMHLREKSKAKFTCVKRYHLPDWQKFLWVPMAFGIAFLLDRLGFVLFHWALQGVALAAIGLLLIIISEKNRAVEKSTLGEIPVEFLPG
jgi:hypothetical protein